jgi:hydroxypyruvate reductase
VSNEAILRNHARAVFDAGVAAANPLEAVRESLSLEGEILRVGTGREEPLRFDLSTFRRIVLIGAGKASGAMAQGVESVLGDRVDEGVVVVKYGHGVTLGRVRHTEAGHPIPDEAGRQGAEAILKVTEPMGERDLIICCLSGGGSALLPAPVPGLSLEDKQTLTKLLLDSGATIEEVNAIRKHCSLIKGGQLARRAYPSTVLTLVLSDVVGDRLDTIASGPLYPDDTTFADCQAILERYRLSERIPPAALIHLKKGLAQEVPETPKRGDLGFSRVHHLVVADNRRALKAAARKARSLGYESCILTASLAVGSSRGPSSLFAGRG